MNPLDQLQDIHLPEQISSWPPAYGWWILLAFTICACYLLFRWWRNRKNILAAKRQAIFAVGQVEEEDNWPTLFNQILKRVCLSYFPAEDVAKLYGDDWQQFLLLQTKPRIRESLESDIKVFIDSLYTQNTNELTFEQAKKATLLWLNSSLPPKSIPPKSKPAPEGKTSMSSAGGAA